MQQSQGQVGQSMQPINTINLPAFAFKQGMQAIQTQPGGSQSQTRSPPLTPPGPLPGFAQQSYQNSNFQDQYPFPELTGCSSQDTRMAVDDEEEREGSSDGSSSSTPAFSVATEFNHGHVSPSLESSPKFTDFGIRPYNLKKNQTEQYSASNKRVLCKTCAAMGKWFHLTTNKIAKHDCKKTNAMAPPRFPHPIRLSNGKIEDFGYKDSVEFAEEYKLAPPQRDEQQPPLQQQQHYHQKQPQKQLYGFAEVGNRAMCDGCNKPVQAPDLHFLKVSITVSSHTYVVDFCPDIIIAYMHQRIRNAGFQDFYVKYKDMYLSPSDHSQLHTKTTRDNVLDISGGQKGFKHGTTSYMALVEDSVPAEVQSDLQNKMYQKNEGGKDTVGFSFIKFDDELPDEHSAFVFVTPKTGSMRRGESVLLKFIHGATALDLYTMASHHFNAKGRLLDDRTDKELDPGLVLSKMSSVTFVCDNTAFDSEVNNIADSLAEMTAASQDPLPSYQQPDDNPVQEAPEIPEYSNNLSTTVLTLESPFNIDGSGFQENGRLLLQGRCTLSSRVQTISELDGQLSVWLSPHFSGAGTFSVFIKTERGTLYVDFTFGSLDRLYTTVTLRAVLEKCDDCSDDSATIDCMHDKIYESGLVPVRGLKLEESADVCIVLNLIQWNVAVSLRAEKQVLYENVVNASSSMLKSVIYCMKKTGCDIGFQSISRNDLPLLYTISTLEAVTSTAKSQFIRRVDLNTEIPTLLPSTKSRANMIEGGSWLEPYKVRGLRNTNSKYFVNDPLEGTYKMTWRFQIPLEFESNKGKLRLRILYQDTTVN
ncbi:hypothetical protein HDU79_010299, partial [Rhizoclosmatium sp. JEL0117]